MVRHVNVTGAESCWEDGFEDDEDCEKYLRSQKTRIRADEAAADVEEDTDEEDVETEADDDTADEYVTAEADDSSTEEDDESDEADEAPDDEAEETAEADSEAQPVEGKKMSKVKTSGKRTKADEIRAIIEAKQEAGVEVRPRDVIEALKKKGIEVNASQVSITLRAMGVPPAKRGGGAKPKAKVAGGDGEAPRSRATARFRAAEEPAEAATGSGDALERAADFLHAAGSYDEAVALLNICRRVLDRQ